MSDQAKGEALLKLLNNKLTNQIIESQLDLGDPVVRIKPDNSLDFFRILKLDSQLSFNMLLDVTAVDWMDRKEQRFEVVYHLLSISHLHRLRVKIYLPEGKPQIESLCSLWSSANFFERECWDMYGIDFHNHPDQRRILMYDEFVGHPLRKDYPVQGKQPRVPMLHPEVENTARLMERPALVQISKKQKAETSAGAA